MVGILLRGKIDFQPSLKVLSGLAGRRASAVTDPCAATPVYAGHMAYDDDLAYRIRELLSGESGVAEKSMFGGLAFLVDGNMAVAASGHGGLMVRVPPDETDAYLARAHTAPMVMSGRETRGWLRVSTEGIRTRRQLEKWVGVGVAYARSLPPK